MSNHHDILKAVEAHLAKTGTSPSQFGRRLGDPNLVFDLRRGREPRSKTQARILQAIRDKHLNR